MTFNDTKAPAQLEMSTLDQVLFLINAPSTAVAEGG